MGKHTCWRTELHGQQQVQAVEFWSQMGQGVNPTAHPLIHCVMAGIVPRFSEPLFSHLWYGGEGFPGGSR